MRDFTPEVIPLYRDILHPNGSVREPWEIEKMYNERNDFVQKLIVVTPMEGSEILKGYTINDPKVIEAISQTFINSIETNKFLFRTSFVECNINNSIEDTERIRKEIESLKDNPTMYLVIKIAGELEALRELACVMALVPRTSMMSLSMRWADFDLTDDMKEGKDYTVDEEAIIKTLEEQEPMLYLSEQDRELLASHLKSNK